MKPSRRKIRIWGIVLGATAAVAVPYFASCHREITCLEKRSGWFSERFDRKIPLFLSWSREANEELKEGDKDDMKQVWGTIDKSVGRFVNFHEEHKNKGPISCAVVATGYTLTDSGYGAAIDSHDYVFRMNNAPMEGYEKDVGTKLTFNILNSGSNELTNYGKDTFAVIWTGGPEVGKVARQVMGTLPPNEEIKRLKISDSPKTLNFLIFSEQFTDYVEKIWFEPDERMTVREWPSTGFRATVLAMHLCDTIDLYGFGPDKYGRWWHYFKKGGIWHGHRPTYQEEFLDKLVKHGVVTRHMGVLDHGDPPRQKKNKEAEEKPAEEQAPPETLPGAGAGDGQ